MTGTPRRSLIGLGVDESAALAVEADGSGRIYATDPGGIAWLVRGGFAETQVAGKPLGLVSASPGLLGGLRSLNFTRQYLSMAIAMMPVPQQFALAKANEAFDEAGALKDPKHQAALEAVVGALVRVAAALKSPSSRRT